MLTSCILFLGYCMGSFITMLTYRYPCMLLHDKKRQLTLFTPRSHCTTCLHTLAPLDNIPLFSYLFLKGKCRYCHAPIDVCYFCIECVTLLVTCLVYYRYVNGSFAILTGSLAFSWILVALAAIDWSSKLLPDPLTLGLLWLGLLFKVITDPSHLSNSVVGAICGYLLLWCLFQVHYCITKRPGMGYGDFKLLAAMGAWLGWKQILPLLWIASVLALIFFVVQYLCLHRKKKLYQLKKIRMPFGPFLSLAGWWLMMDYPLFPFISILVN